MTTTAVNSIQIPLEFVSLCAGWHGGQDTVLHTIAATGNLTIGTQRPADCESDEDWYLHLWGCLDSEISHVVRQVSEDAPDHEDLAVLDRFQKFAERTADKLRRESDSHE